MGFEGRLDTVSFGDILNTLCTISKEGVLIIQDDKQRKVVHFRDNGITLIGGNHRVRLGDMLLQAGKIREWELENALNEQKQTNKMLGEILVERGVITEEDLEDLICDQIEQEICDVFFWENAYFSFHEGPPKDEFGDGDEAPITLMFDVQSVLLRIADQIGKWEEIRKHIPSFSKVFVMASEHVEFTLPEGQSEEILQKIGQQLDGTHDVNDVIRLTELPTLTVCEILSFLHTEGAIREANFDELSQIAEDCYKKGQVQRSLHFMEKALALHPDNAALLLKIAQRYETIGGKKAGEYYGKLAEITSDPKVAIRYYESAISYQPTSIPLREKILGLAEHLESEKKESRHSRVLAELYQQEGAYEKAASLCNAYLDKYPKDMDFRHILIQGYLKQGETRRAIEEYENMAGMLEQTGNLKASLESLQKIVEIDPTREDVKKHIKHLERVVIWSGKRNVLLAGMIGGFLLLAILGYAVFYEISSRNLYKNAHQYTDRQRKLELYQEIIENYGYSSVASKAKQELAALKIAMAQEKKTANNSQTSSPSLEARQKELQNDLKEVEKLANENRRDEALQYLSQCEHKYREWPDLYEKIAKKKGDLESSGRNEGPAKFFDQLLLSIKENCNHNNLDEAVANYLTLKAQLDTVKLEGYEKKKQEAERDIQKLAAGMIRTSLTTIEEAYTKGSTNQAAGSSLEDSKKYYGTVLQEYQKISALRLPKELETEEIKDLWRKIENKKRFTEANKQEIQSWEEGAQEKIKEVRKKVAEAEKLAGEADRMNQESERKAKKEESNRAFEQAFQMALDLLAQDNLSRTQACREEAFLPFRIETEPMGAIIVEEGDVKTPYTYFLPPGTSTDLTFTYTGFTSRQIRLGSGKLLDCVEADHQSALNEGSIPPTLSDSLKKQQIRLLPGATVTTDAWGMRWTINNHGQKFLIEKDYQRGGKLNIYLSCGPVSTFRLTKETLWSQDIQSEKGRNLYIGGNLLVRKNRIYLTTHANKVFVLDARKKDKILWTFSGTKGIAGEMRGGAALYKDTLYAGSSDQYLYAIDIDKKVGKWEFDAGDVISHAPVVKEENVYFATEGGKVFSLNCQNAKVEWTCNIGEPVSSPPLRCGQYILIGTESGILLVLNLMDGKEAWKKNMGKKIKAVAGYSPAYAWVGTVDGSLYCLNLDKLYASDKDIILWKVQMKGEIAGSINVTSASVYVGTTEGYFYKVDRVSHMIEWETKLPAAIYGKTIPLGDSVYVPCMNGYLYLCDDEGGRIIWLQQYSKQGLRSDLIIDEDVMYLATEDGTVYALPTK